jgi:hypothetical protein
MPDSPLWAAALRALPHDVYQLPEYVSFAARWQEPGQPRAFVAEEENSWLLVPLILRTLPETLQTAGHGHLDAVSPRGYAGLLSAAAPGTAGTEFLDRAVRAFTATLCEHGIISAFIRLHPLFPPSLEVLRGAGSVVVHGDSVAVDLRRPDELLWQQTRSNHRRDILRARRLGYTVRIDDDWIALPSFVEVYRQSMERLGAAAFWHLPQAYFEDLRGSLGDRLRLCVAELDGEVAAAALLTEVGGIVEYHLAGTAHAHVNRSPSKLIIDYARRWATERGNHTLHLAGSLRPGDALNHFKLGFSPIQHPVCSWRVVPDPAAYTEVTQLARHRSGAHGSDEYFPAYRSPSFRAND